MPILRACTACGAPFEPRHTNHRHCPVHEPRGNEHRSPTTRHRPSSSTERERLRNTILPPGARCAIRLPGCEGEATVMDHIIAVADGGNHEPSNLRPACHHCNSVLGGHTSAGTFPPSVRPEQGRDDRDSGPPISRGVGRPAPVRSRRLH